MNERTQRLKSKLMWKGVKADIDSKGRVLPSMARGGKLSLERARLITESYKATEGEPMIMRRAKSLAHILRNMTIYIQEGELIVGNYSPSPGMMVIHPEVSLHWLMESLNDGYRGMLDDKEMEEYREIAKYWSGKTVFDHVIDALPKELVFFTRYNGVAWTAWPTMFRPSYVPDMDRIFRMGLFGILEQIRARLREVEDDSSLPSDEYVDQKNNLEAMLISVEAAIAWGKRYAALAREMGSKEKDEKRKAELHRIAEVCEWVPGHPPRTLHEALQSYYFINVMMKQIEHEGQGLGHRLDVLMNPFYQKERQERRLTREEAQELLECLLIKAADWQYLKPPQVLHQGAIGQGALKDIVIGGLTPEGDDATNEFSFIILDASEALQLPEPTVVLRYHPTISPKLVSRAIDVIRTGLGFPAIFNDSALVPWFLSTGWSLEKARNYGIPQCVGAVIIGENYRASRTACGVINLTKCLELALYQGRDKEKYTGKQLGPKTPDLRKANSLEEVMDAYLQQVRFFASKLSRIDGVYQVILERYFPMPFGSALVNGCIEKGKHTHQWTTGHGAKFHHTGSTNVANSLAAIKKFVLDEKRLTMEELIEACWTNFEGREDLRQELINKAPKYGNDDDNVDKVARWVHVTSDAELRKLTDRFGTRYGLDGSIVAGYFAASMYCGALPDGKKDGDPVADGACSPTAGTDRHGPTAVLKSLGKIPYTYHHLFNQKFLPQFLEGANKEKFAHYLKTWCDLGCGHVQFNVVDRATLLDAQAHPEKYPNLIVRVAGYSAYFVDLPRGLQDDIIRRTEQRFPSAETTSKETP